MEPFYLLHFTYGVDYDHRVRPWTLFDTCDTARLSAQLDGGKYITSADFGLPSLSLALMYAVQGKFTPGKWVLSRL